MFLKPKTENVIGNWFNRTIFHKISVMSVMIIMLTRYGVVVCAKTLLRYTLKKIEMVRN